LQILLSRNIAWYSESFIHISGRKQKLSLSKLKSAILQLSTRHYHDCYTENANKTNCVELIWKDKYPPNSSDLSPLEYHVWDAMLDMYQCYTPKPKHLRRWRTLCKRSELTCLKAKISSQVVFVKSNMRLFSTYFNDCDNSSLADSMFTALKSC